MSCIINKCNRRAETKEMCDLHYKRSIGRGRPLTAPIRKKTKAPKFDTPDQYFYHYVQIGEDNECWNWTGPKDPKGYGKMLHKDAFNVKPHRYCIEYFEYDILDDTLTVDHLCKNKLCCNPTHLEQVTIAENNRRN